MTSEIKSGLTMKKAYKHEIIIEKNIKTRKHKKSKANVY